MTDIKDAIYPDADVIVSDYRCQGYYCVYCPYCNEEHNVEIDCNDILTCDSCNEYFNVTAYI